MRTSKLLLAVLLFALSISNLTAEPLGSAFSYQGRLTDIGAPANGLYDFSFVLHSNSVATDSIVSAPVFTNAVPVSNGLFTVTLDFGAAAFAGEARWLQMAVRTNGAVAFVTLSPRQPLSPTPYALYAPTAGAAANAESAGTATSASTVPWSGITGIPAGFADGTDNDTIYTAGLGLMLSGAQFSVSFAGSGSASTAARSDHDHAGAYAAASHPHSAADVTSGTLSDARLSANVALLDANQGFTASNRFAGVVEMTNVNNTVVGTFSGSGSGLTSINPANLSPGTAAISISGNAATATSAGSATTATTAGTAASFTSPLAGDVTGTQTATAVGAIRGRQVSSSAPAPNEFLRYDGSQWAPGAVALATDVTGTLSDARLSANVALLDANQAFTGSNRFAGVLTATNATNALVGKFTGDGAGLTNVQPANLAGGTAPINISGMAATASIADHVVNNGVTSAAIAPNQVVKSLNGLRDDVTLAQGANLTLTPSGQTLTLATPTDWHVTGNASTTPGTHFLGTTDNQPFEMKVNNQRALRLEPTSAGPNVIAGYQGNQVSSGITSATIAGGGSAAAPHLVSGFGGTVGGGAENQAQGMVATVGGGQANIAGGDGATVGGGAGNTTATAAQFATIPGGALNSVTASYGFAAGRRAKANHQGSFVWGDSTDADFASGGNNQFLIRATGGVGIGKNNPASALDVNGIVTATGFNGVGSGLTTLNAANLSSGAVPDARLSANVALRAGGNAFTGAQSIMSGTLGIGTATPLSTLQVQDPSGNQGSIQVGAPLAGSDPKLIHFGDRQTSGLGYVYIGEQGQDDTLELRAGRFYFNNGFVGIGTGEPQQPLDVRGYARVLSLQGQPGQALDMFVGSQRGLRLEPTTEDANHVGSVNFVAGSAANWVATGVRGATIGGGGAWILSAATCAQSISADYATIGGGVGNRILSGALYSVIGGGAWNDNSGENDTIGGGRQNVIESSATEATIAGGRENFIQSGVTCASIGGGGKNRISGTDSVIGGGFINSASGLRSTVPGGYLNVAGADYTFAAGNRAKATHQGAFVWADSTDVDFDPWVHCAGGYANSFNVRATGGIYFVTGIDGSGHATAGPYVSGGSGSWSWESDRKSKDNFAPVDGREILNRVVELPITSWNYKSQPPEIRHLGPMAQDFSAAFGLGETDTGISSVDANGVALAAIQGLNQKLEQVVAEREARIAQLEARLTALERIVSQLSPQNGGTK
jgi:hypothetical protein